MLDRLPLGEMEVETATEAILRRVFEAFRLEVAYNRHTNRAECEATCDFKRRDCHSGRLRSFKAEVVSKRGKTPAKEWE